MSTLSKADLALRIKAKPVKGVSLFLLIGSVVLAAAQLYKGYVINTGYDRPAPLMVYPIIFQYVSFSIVPPLFSFTWGLSNKTRLQKALFALVGLILFVLLYLLIFNTLEWYAVKPKYDLWPSYPFVLQHSGPWVAVVYGVIATLVLFTSPEKHTEADTRVYTQRIAVKNRNETSYIAVEDILFLEASDNYISIITRESRPKLVRQTLASIEEELNPQLFQRIHRKYIVNLRQIQSWKADPNGGYILNMPGDRQLKMSKSYKAKLHLITVKS